MGKGQFIIKQIDWFNKNRNNKWLTLQFNFVQGLKYNQSSKHSFEDIFFFKENLQRNRL